MKNLHVVPTEKASRLFTANQKLIFDNENPATECIAAQHIHITSDQEIKGGDYFIESLGLPDSYLVHKLSNEWKDKESFYRRCAKVILTTDADLIADGVQAIDDEFLEWFVENPSCESVKVGIGFSNENDITDISTDYLIIIPKEKPIMEDEFEFQSRIINKVWDKDEPKQDKWNKLNKELDDALELEFSLDKSIFDKMASLSEPKEPKQETLEEVANKLWKQSHPNPIEMALFGAKWQAERMYSEEEVIKIVEKSRETGLTAEFLLLTEQFKKK